MKEKSKQELSLDGLTEESIKYCDMDWGEFCLKLKKAIFGNYDKELY